MRHRKLSKRLKRPLGHRRATLRNLVIALLKYQKIKTTSTKAKVVRSFFERLISLAKKDSLSARRHAFKVLNNRAALGQLFSKITPLFKSKSSGFTRIIPLSGFRRGDGAEMVLLELTEKLPRLKPTKPEKQKPGQGPPPSRKPEKPKTETREPKHKLIAEEKAQPAKEKPKDVKKVKAKKFLGGLRNLFKKGRDSL